MTNKPTGMSSKEKTKRDLLFVPCDTKEHLHQWVKVYLGLDMPDCIVCDNDINNPPSNSSPMDLIWEMYFQMRQGNNPDFVQVLGFSAREAFKTMSAAVIETLCLLHLGRSVGHLAAQENQALYCRGYIDKFFRRPILNEFVTSKNRRNIEITKYISIKDKTIISPVEWQALSKAQKEEWEAETTTITIIVATVEGANGLHAPFLVCDELDLADPKAFEEAKMIPSMGPNRCLPMTFLTSTRKSTVGLVQKEIDNAGKTGLQIRHWNLIDVTEKCSPTRHLPEEPKAPIYFSETRLEAISEEAYLALSINDRNSFMMEEGFAGCLSKCKLYASCRGRLISKQTSVSPLLKPIDHTQSTIGKVSVDYAKAQYLCWKPSSEGLIFPFFSRETHMLSPAGMAGKISGESYHRNFEKSDLIDLMNRFGAAYVCGLDFGFTHKFSVITGALIGGILYVFDVISVSNLEPVQKVQLCKDRIAKFKPIIYPDNAYPADIALFRKHGFKMRDFKKDILGGIEAVRQRIMPGSGQMPTLYLLKGDPDCEMLASKITQYHWKMDKKGDWTDEPSKNNDDEIDALRYLCHNTTNSKSQPMVFFGDSQDTSLIYQKNITNGWMSNRIRELCSENGNEGDPQITGSDSDGLTFII